MLTGVELPPETPEIDDRTRAKLLAVRPQLVKVRFANVRYLQEIAGLLPDVRFLSRPESAGYTRDEIVWGYQAMASAMMSAQVLSRWYAHELSNEPNHTAGPWRGLKPHGYRAQLERALLAIGTPVTQLLLPGLQPMNGIAAWSEMYDGVQRRQPGLSRGSHIYGQGDRVAERLADGFLQTGPARPADIIVSELGDSSLVTEGWQENDPEDVRVERNLRVMRELSRRGVAAACLFLLDSSNPRWAGYVFGAQDVRRILDGANAPGNDILPPGRKPAMTLDDVRDLRITASKHAAKWRRQLVANRATALHDYCDQHRLIPLSPEFGLDDGTAALITLNGVIVHWLGNRVVEV